MEEYEEAYTPVFHSINTQINLQDLCRCYHSYYDDYDSDCCCGAPQDPRILTTRVYVRVLGRPIRFKPEDATYAVRIWHDEVLESELDDDVFDDSNLVAEFSICSTVDPVDLEREHGEILKRYVYLGDEKKRIMYHTGFRGPKKLDSYQYAFEKLVDNIKNPPPPREENKCAHMEMRKRKIGRKR
jgi:hypothetical protein